MRALRAVALTLVGSLALGVLSACSTEQAGTRHQAIAEGAPDEATTAVVHIQTSGGNGSACSGVLVTPDVVLTAAHCVTGQALSVDCESESSALAAPLDPSLFRLTAEPDLQTSHGAPWPVWKAKKAHLFASVGTSLCGNDVAALVLTESIPSDLVAPLLVQLGASQAGDLYSAVGYGSGHTSGTGEGIRRKLDDLSVRCTGRGCEALDLDGAAGAPASAPPLVSGDEFLGSDGACPGDSGGPALAGDTVIGLVSRGHEDCSAPIYSTLPPALPAFIRKAAEEGGYAVPAWAKAAPAGSGGAPTAAPDHDAGAAGAPSDDASAPTATGGCHLARAPNAAGSAIAFLGFAALLSLALFRRRTMQRSLHSLALLTAALLLLGCDVTPRDTEGRTFNAECEKNDCTLNLVTPEGVKLYSVHKTSRILSACAPDDPRGFDCRPLVCDDGRACSTLGGAEFSCLRGLCQAAERPLSNADFTSLCLAGTGPFQHNAAQVERITFGRAASGRSEVPVACRQP